jgi:membrane protein DedA with SNARE-associated domain
VDRAGRGDRRDGDRDVGGAGRPETQRRPVARLNELIAFLEQLPPRPLYALITALAAVENIFPPVPADVAVSLGALLAGRGVMNGWLVFGLVWAANVGSGIGVYILGRKHGRAVFRGVLGQRLFSDAIVGHIQEQYAKHGAWGIYVSRLLPVWRGVVMPFAGIANVPAWQAIIPLAAASATYYGLLTLLVTTLGNNLEGVLSVLGRVNAVLGIVTGVLLVLGVLWIARRLRS